MEALRMPVNLSIKNAPDDLVALLKQRAQRNHRSLQGEMLAIIEEAVGKPKPLSPDKVLAKARRLGLSPEPTSVSIVRSDRDGH
jgi:plasmid stability protein